MSRRVINFKYWMNGERFYYFGQETRRALRMRKEQDGQNGFEVLYHGKLICRLDDDEYKIENALKIQRAIEHNVHNENKDNYTGDK